MFNRNRIIGAAFGVAPYIIAAALLVFGTFSFLSVREYQKQNTSYRQETSSYSAEATEKYAADCLKDFKPISTWANCIIKSIDANRTAQRANQDLKAQQEMAEWAYALLLLSIGGLVISGCGLIALFVSLSQTRTVIKDTREIGEAQVRAYLSAIECEVSELKLSNVNGDMGVAVEILINNSGQSPAFDVRAIIRVNADGTINSDAEDSVTNEIVLSTGLEPNADGRWLTAWPAKMKSSNPADKNKSITIEGVLQYRTVFSAHAEDTVISETFIFLSKRNKDSTLVHKIVDGEKRFPLELGSGYYGDIDWIEDIKMSHKRGTMEKNASR
jgi:hypothetical protein